MTATASRTSECRWLARALAVLAIAGPPSEAMALTCADLDGSYVVSQESTQSYLGFFGNTFASESINNSFGTYGSTFSASSVRNTFGSYGSQFGIYSASNSFTSTPPAIFKWGGLIGYLTTNPFVFGGVSLAIIDANCTFFSSSPRTYPFIPVGVVASDGAYTDKIIVLWNPSSGATQYRVYY
jgi:hypothetical protein